MLILLFPQMIRGIEWMRRQLQRRNLQQKRNSVVNRSQGTLSKGDEEMGSEIIQDEEAMKRIEELVVSDRSSTMLVCIQGTEEGEVCGEIYSCYLKEPIWFSGVGDMVLKLDEMCNWVGAPYPTTDYRFLNREMERQYREDSAHHPQVSRDNLVYSIDRIPFQHALKAREVLVVYIKYRQNSSLQGSVRGRITKGEVVSFRSALELMRMVRMIQV